ncbi:4-hydroxy-tetrahydrodipicolinate reductase [hydrothermal vent metagenome]|uniref:4-hydroxy-tetrahydrodipicolinate reductase n=1 Tax=hydrothermal vent metagenome TaxID=652676 RepID=A0A3B1CJ86_9ZZZZ
MVKAIVTGCAGRMGRSIVNIIDGTDGIDVCGGTELAGSGFIGRDIGEVAGCGSLGVAISDEISEIIGGCDVIIDFSIPSASLEHFLKAEEAGKAIVIGTTGFTGEHWKTFEAMEKNIRAVIAPNMSVGVNLLFKLTREAASIIGRDYDIEIVEMHHNKKIDAPSGTANRLAEIAAEAVERDLSKVGKYGREGEIGVRPPSEIGVMSLRGGDVVGEHTVIFAGKGERIELSHKAGSRDNFAMGAVKGAIWVVDQPAGIFDMQDVLGFK